MAKESLLPKFQQVPVQRRWNLVNCSHHSFSILGNDISLTFMLLFLVFVIVLFFSKTYYGRILSSSATTVLPSIGILGTFIGVFIALLNFDANNMEGSMTLIIGGKSSICNLHFWIINRNYCQTSSIKKE